MSRKPIKTLALLALAALALVGAGCGGKKSSSAGASGGSSSSAQPAKNCKEFEQAAQKVGKQFQAALTSAKGSADVQKAADLFDQVTRQAPSEIRSDFQTIDDAFQKLAKAMKGVDLKNPKPEEVKRLQKAAAGIDQKKLAQAQQNITAWAQKNCKS